MISYGKNLISSVAPLAHPFQPFRVWHLLECGTFLLSDKWIYRHQLPRAFVCCFYCGWLSENLDVTPPVSRQHCRLTICKELEELTNGEAAAAPPPTVIQTL